MKIKQYIISLWILFCFFLIHAFQMRAQEYKINRVEETANTVIYSITQDRDGFIWFGGGLGLVKHNGYQLNYYQHDPFVNSLSNNDVGCIYVDQEGMIWAATWGGGVNRFNPYTGEFIQLNHQPAQSNSLSDNRVQNIYQDRSGIMWFGTYTGGLNSYDPKSGVFERYYHQPSNSNSLSHNRVWCVTEDSSGALWIATDQGLDRLDKNRRFFSHFYHDPKNKNSISDNQIQWLYIDREHMLWIATKNGLNRYQLTANKFERFYHQPNSLNSLSSNLTYSILEDRNGYLWIGTNDGGLNRLDKKTGNILRLYHEPKNTNSISNNDIRSIFEDRSGVLWIGTRGGGINTIDLKPKKFYHVYQDILSPGGINHNSITAFATDQNGSLWIGTDGGGVNVFHPKSGSFSVFMNQNKKNRSLSHNRIRTIYQDRKGSIWIGTYGGGLNQYRPETEDFIRYEHQAKPKQSLSNDRVNAILEDHQGFLWIGTDEGLNRFNPATGEFKCFLNHPGDSTSLSHNSVLSIYQEQSGVLWIGTWGGGLNRYDPVNEIFIRYSHQQGNPNSISNNEIFCVHEDQNKRLWVGTRGGLNRLDRTTQSFRSYTTEHGLPINEILGILEDSHNNLWISTTNGISKFHPASETFRNYDMDDGLQGRQFKQGAYLTSKEGKMFFGGLNGFNWFYPDSIHDNTYIPPIVINTFKIFDQSLSIRQSLSSTDMIELNYEQDFFSFEFAALDYSNPQKNQYAYKLDGFDSRWIYSGSRHYASYTNLDAGDYVFVVKGSNNDGIWNETGLNVNIHIAPPFWLTWWFRIIVSVSLITLAIAIYQLRIRSIKIYQRTLENQVADRTVELTGNRNELENKKEQLEKINLIAQTINAEIHLDQLLISLIRETELIQGTIRASVYVYHSVSDDYHFAASTDETDISTLGLSFTEQDMNQRYMERSTELFPDLFAIKANNEANQNRIYNTVVFRIRVRHQIEGYLIFRASDHEGIKFYELSLLNDLREHIISAFIKAKLLFDQKRINDELIRLNDTKNEFLGIAAHDLRNPLTAIIGYIDLILDDMNAEKFNTGLIKKDLNTVLMSAQQMVKLITNLLDISAIESGKINLDLKCQNINRVFEECEKLNHNTAQHKNIHLQIEKNPELPDIFFDMSRMIEAVDNLISNAVKYTHAGGTVRLFSQLTENTIVTHIQDTGLGMNDDDLKDMFTSFKKLSARPTGGESSTGLGLAIVKKIVEIHGGEIWVKSQKGEGSTFSFSLPVTTIYDSQNN